MRAIAIITLCLLAGCNTMNGLGEDMQAAGAKLSAKSQEESPPPPPPPPPQAVYPDEPPLSQP